MTVPKIFETCRPRADVLKGSVVEADFAADLARVVVGEGSKQYRDPALFFANSYPTKGLKNLLAHTCRRLSGAGGEVAPVFRLDTAYGGGKTHGLIALTHAARGMKGVSDIAEFVDPARVPKGAVRVAAFDGENADPANGRAMGDGVLAHTPWGEIAWALAGKAGYERVRKSDEDRTAPGAETLRELFGGEPALILLDELSVYLRKAGAQGRGQLTAFLTSLFKAVEGAPNAALVYTLAIGKDGIATDAYAQENRSIADAMAEAGSVSGRKATLLDPTEEDETVQVLRRRLFESIDAAAAAPAIDAYREIWATHRDALGADAARPETVADFRTSYPFHPEVLETLTGKTATLANFQRVRGMLRLLAHTVAHLWEERPDDAAAVHLHHIDPGHDPVRQELVTRLDQRAFDPAISRDVAGGGKPALAEEIDAERHAGMPPYAAYVARTAFMHTLAFNEPLKGVSPEHLRFSVLSPGMDLGFIEEARKRFVAESAYLDDRPGAPMRFLAEANLRQIVRGEERHVDAGEVRTELNDRIRGIFSGEPFEMTLFPGGPWDVPDEVGDGRPKLIVLAYDGVTVGGVIERVPELVARIYGRKGAEGSAFRMLRNHLVFAVADDSHIAEMKGKTRSRLALRELKKPERLADLAPHQQAQLLEWEARSEQELALAIQQCYRHVFYPSRNRLGGGDVDMEHSAIDIHSASDKPGAGQRHIARALRDLKKLRLPDDEPDSPAWVRDRTPLKKGAMTTLALRDEFRRDPALPMLIGDKVFVRGVELGVERGEYVYRRGKLLFGPGDPPAAIEIDEQAEVLTMTWARNKEIWPRKKPDEEDTDKKKPDDRIDKPVTPSPPTPRLPQPPTRPESFTAEGLLKEALLKLWEQARAGKVETVGVLTVRMFEAEDGFKLLGAVGAVPGAEKVVTLTGGYETGDGGSFELEFRGSVLDAQPVKEFLLPQLRAAESRTLEAGFELTFEEGLPMAGDAAEKLTERLSRFAGGAAYVSATAQAKAG